MLTNSQNVLPMACPRLGTVRFALTVYLTIALNPLASGQGTAHASAKRPALFALIIGVNKTADRELKPLRYADDDAARYFELFESLGARSYLMTAADENTRRLHSQAIKQAHRPSAQVFDQLTALIAADVEDAKRRGKHAVFYFIYAGHGNMKRGQGYLGLADDRLTGDALRRRLIDRVKADATHMIVDACYSYFLAFGRGAGGKRRPARGFTQLSGLMRLPRVGLLLSTSAAQQSHEWEGFQAGVFSHEVRSGFYGAADANEDGIVSYREIASFVKRANAAIANERYRPRVLARSPKSTKMLLDLRRKRKSRLVVTGKLSAHYLVEDRRGVRIADFHNARGHKMYLIAPHSGQQLFVRRLHDQKEFLIPQRRGVIRLASITPRDTQTRSRGAAHYAFSRVFSLPFSPNIVATYRSRHAQPDWIDENSWFSGRRAWGWSLVGVATAAALSGAGLSLHAWHLRRSANDAASQVDIETRNRRIDRRNTAAIGLYATAGAAALGGLAILLWPDTDSKVSSAASVTPLENGAAFSWSGNF